MEKLLTPEDVAELLQVKVKTVKDWLRSGKLRGIKAGNLWRIEQDAIDEYINRQRTAQEMELEEKVKTRLRKAKTKGKEVFIFGTICMACGHEYTARMDKLQNRESMVCPGCGFNLKQADVDTLEAIMNDSECIKLMGRQEEEAAAEKVKVRATGHSRFEPGQAKRKQA